MPQLEYFLVCRSVMKDMNTDEMSFIHVLEDVAPEAYPHIIPSVTAISLWNIDPEEAGTDYQATLIVTTPGEEPVPFEMNLSKGRMRYRAIQTVLSIPISTAGFLTFEVLLNRKHVATHKVVLHDPETYNPFGSHLRPGADR